VKLVPVKATKSFSFLAGAGQSVDVDAADLVVAKHVGSQRYPSQEVTLLLPRPAFKAACVLGAELRLGGLRVSGTPADVGVFPSAALAFTRSQTPEVPSQLLDNQPSGHAVANAGDSRLSVDVTELVRTWLSGVFPSQQATVPRSTPLLLTVQPPDLTDGRYLIAFAGVGSQDGPVLFIRVGC
jgi:hypothetical protein